MKAPFHKYGKLKECRAVWLCPKQGISPPEFSFSLPCNIFLDIHSQPQRSGPGVTPELNEGNPQRKSVFAGLIFLVRPVGIAHNLSFAYFQWPVHE